MESEQGRAARDRQVEDALFKRACGYEAEDVVTEENERGAKTRKNRYHVPGDVRAMIFWLQSSRPDAWQGRAEERETEEKEVSIVDNIP